MSRGCEKFEKRKGLLDILEILENPQTLENKGDSDCSDHFPGEIKVSTSTVAALFSKMALTGQRIAMVDMVFLVLQHFHINRRGGWSQSSPLKILFSCSLGGGGGGRYFSVPCFLDSLEIPPLS